MKILKTLTLILLSILTFSCSSDDDSSSDGGDQSTTRELLTSGTWYLESKTPGDFTDCEKNSSFKFNTNDTVVVDSFGDDSGPCESLSIVNTTYTLNGGTLAISLGDDTITATINSISETVLNITDEENDTIVFDKTQG